MKINSGDANFAVDIWAVGIILYELFYWTSPST